MHADRGPAVRRIQVGMPGTEEGNAQAEAADVQTPAIGLSAPGPDAGQGQCLVFQHSASAARRCRHEL